MVGETQPPAYSSSHSIGVSATPERCYECLRQIDIGRSLGSRLLLAIRGLRNLRTLDSALGAGFVVLSDEAATEIVLGLVGQPWPPSGNVQRLSPQELLTFKDPGFVKVVWGFEFEATPAGCAVATRTLIYATDDRARRNFGRYWWFIRPFSGALRRSMLRSVTGCAESRR